MLYIYKQAAADGEKDYIHKLLEKAVEFLSSTKQLELYDLIKICNDEGFNMLHAAIINKRFEVIEEIFSYDSSKIHVAIVILYAIQ